MVEKLQEKIEKVKQAVKRCGLDSECVGCPYENQHCSELDRDIITVIDCLEAKVPRWISVKDDMPTGLDPVLILVKETEHYGLQKENRKVYYCQYMAYWDEDEWFTTWCNGCRKISDTAKEPYADDYEVTHWMPLPEAPKGEAE